jgi:hypothetical protein
MNDFFVVLVAMGFFAMIVYALRRARKVDTRRPAKPTDEDSVSQSELESALKKAYKVASAYKTVLEVSREFGIEEPGIMYYSLSDLPFTKSEIRGAIELLLLIERDDAERNSLEVCDMKLNNYVPDKEYLIVRQQLGGLSQSLKEFYSDERLRENMLQARERGVGQMPETFKRDIDKLRETIVAGTTPEGEAQLRQIEERVHREHALTLKRHREIRQDADRMRESQRQD